MADQPPERHTVAIIGAGISGLAAAAFLVNAGHDDLVILEARPDIGGRVQQVQAVLPWPVEAGPEFIHGGTTSLTGLLEDMGCQLRERAWPDAWYHAHPADGTDADRQRVMELMDDLGSHKLAADAADESVASWLLRQGANKRMLDIAEACYANDFGCSLEDLGLRESITENQLWEAGDSYLLLDRSLQELVHHIARPVQSKIRTSWPVTHISATQRSDALLALEGPQGLILCQRAIVTVPLTMLQQRQIRFQPALPRHKLQALSRLRMGNAVKVILAFSRCFWPPELFDVVCTDCFIPEFWCTRYPASGPVSGSSHAAPRSPASAPALQSLPTPQPDHELQPHHTESSSHAAGSLQDSLSRGPAFNATPELPTSLQRSKGISAAGGRSVHAEGLEDMAASSSGPEQGSEASFESSSSSRHWAEDTKQQVFGLVGFVCGRKADQASRMGSAAVSQAALQQLDAMYGCSRGHPALWCFRSLCKPAGPWILTTIADCQMQSSVPRSGTAEHPQPATAACIRAHVVDWSQQPYVRGAYSHPSLGAHSDDREALAAPVDGKIFFAGEATHPAVNPCLQAAYETGQRAAQELLSSLARPKL